MKVAKQFSVMLPNQPGQLAMLCQKLAAKKVNVRAISVAETTEQGIVRLVADPPAAARQVVKKARLGCVESSVLLLELVDKPGSLARVATALARASVNVQFVYGSTCPAGCDSTVVIGVDDIARAKKLF